MNRPNGLVHACPYALLAVASLGACDPVVALVSRPSPANGATVPDGSSLPRAVSSAPPAPTGSAPPTATTATEAPPPPTAIRSDAAPPVPSSPKPLKNADGTLDAAVLNGLVHRPTPTDTDWRSALQAVGFSESEVKSAEAGFESAELRAANLDADAEDELLLHVTFVGTSMAFGAPSRHHFLAWLDPTSNGLASVGHLEEFARSDTDPDAGFREVAGAEVTIQPVHSAGFSDVVVHEAVDDGFWPMQMVTRKFITGRVRETFKVITIEQAKLETLADVNSDMEVKLTQAQYEKRGDDTAASPAIAHLLPPRVELSGSPPKQIKIRKKQNGPVAETLRFDPVDRAFSPATKSTDRTTPRR